MKTFQQFQEQTPASFKGIEDILRQTATNIGTNNPDLPKQIRGLVINQVKKKLLPDEKLDKIGTKVKDGFNKAGEGFEVNAEKLKNTFGPGGQAMKDFSKLSGILKNLSKTGAVK